MAKATKRKTAPGDVATNRRASHRFQLLDRLECGVVLTGTEVKALREGKAPPIGSLAGRRGSARRRLGRVVAALERRGCAVVERRAGPLKGDAERLARHPI